MNHKKLLLPVFSCVLVVLLVVACGDTSSTPAASIVSSQATTATPEASVATLQPEAEIPTDTSTPVSPTPVPVPSPVIVPTLSPLTIEAQKLHDFNDRSLIAFVRLFRAGTREDIDELVPVLKELQSDLDAFQTPDNEPIQNVKKTGLEYVDNLLKWALKPNIPGVDEVLSAKEEYDSAFARLASEMETPPANTSVDHGCGQLLYTKADNIWLMTTDGTEPTKLTSKKSSDPRWSPDGRSIAFISVNQDDDKDLFIMNADGTGVTNLTNDAATDESPDWSADGTQIIFTSYSDKGSDVYLVNSDGTQRKELLDYSKNDRLPVWSPDGEQIAFTSNREGNQEIYVMNADGTDVTRLTNNKAFSPTWSPDGKQIAFISDRDGNQEIYVMNADGTDVTRLTNDQHQAYENAPVWSPDGKWILFSSNRFFNDDIFMVSVDDSLGPIRLTADVDDERIGDCLP